MKLLYKLIPIALLAGFVMNVNAQDWQPHNSGLPAGMVPGTVYGKGSAMIVTQKFGAPEVYYTPNSSTAFTASSSTLGASGDVTTDIVHSNGAEYVGCTTGIWKSTDDGHTWTATGMTSAIYVLYAHNDSLYASVGTGYNDPYQSIDGGATWSALTHVPGLITAYIKINNALFSGTTHGIYYSLDNGGSWVSVNGSDILGFASLNGSVYAATTTGVLQAYGDFAWLSVFSEEISCIYAMDTSLFVGTDNNGIFQSNHLALNWIQRSAGLPNAGAGSYTSVTHITSNNDYLIAAVAGNSSVYTRSFIPVPTGVTTAQKTAMNVTLMPNPATNELTINISNATVKEVSVSIYDMAGRKIKSVNASTASINVDLSDMATGTYFAHIYSGSEESVKKFDVVK